ncbi:MAG: hypothetical protein ACTSWX_08450, partial [Promethearchaeota archaeon]
MSINPSIYDVIFAHFKKFKYYLIILTVYSLISYIFQHTLRGIFDELRTSPSILSKIIAIGLDLLLLFIIKLIYMGFCGVISSINKSFERKELLTARNAFITALILNILIGGAFIIITIAEPWLPPVILNNFGLIEDVTKILIAIFHIIGWINFGNFLRSVSKVPIPFLNISWFGSAETLLVIERIHNIIFHLNEIYRDYMIDILNKNPLNLPNFEINFHKILLIIEAIVLIGQIFAYFLYFKGFQWIMYL